jgi:hypothetical protein
MFDFARSVAIGGQASTAQAELLDALRGSVAAGIELLRPGVPLAEVAARCDDVLAASAHARRHGVPAHTMSGFWGHGLGVGWEPPWIGPGSRELVEEGMCLALERRAAVDGLGVRSTRTTCSSGPTAPSCSPDEPHGRPCSAILARRNRADRCSRSSPPSGSAPSSMLTQPRKPAACSVAKIRS